MNSDLCLVMEEGGINWVEVIVVVAIGVDVIGGPVRSHPQGLDKGGDADTVVGIGPWSWRQEVFSS